MSPWNRILEEADLVVTVPSKDGEAEAHFPFRKIKAGEFRMGSREGFDEEKPAHQVIISHDFYLGSAPVTQEQWRVLASWSEDLAKDPGLEPSHFKGERNPVEQVSWDDVKKVCAGWNENRKEWEFQGDEALMPLDLDARLPNEAEWEYACRAGSETEYANGDGEEALRQMGWFGEEYNTGSTHPVGELEANKWGLYDMHGNVFEWCEDEWDEHAYRKRVDGWKPRDWIEDVPGSDLQENSDGPFRVIRGGSWNGTAWWCRSAYRVGWLPGYRFRNRGFRLLLAPVPCGGRRENKPESGATFSESGPPGAGSGGTERKAEGGPDSDGYSWNQAKFSPQPNEES